MKTKYESGLKFDYDYGMDYGYWKCRECSNEFYGGGEALHDKNCLAKDNGTLGYKSCTYHFGPKEAKITKKIGFSPYCGRLTIETLTKCFPHLLQR